MLFDEFLISKKKKNRLCHVHIPKTAGTSVNMFFQGADFYKNWGHVSYNEKTKIQGKVKVRSHPLMKATNQWTTYKELTTTGDLNFAITRNPFPWLFSYYHHQGSRLFGLIKHNGWQGCCDIYDFKSFNEFIDYFLGTPDWHFPPLLKSPLGQILDNENKYRADFIIATETLQTSIPILANHFSFKYNRQLGWLNSGKYKTDYRKFYTDRHVAMIFDKYKSFFKLTNYGFDSVFIDNKKFIFQSLT